MVISDKHRFAFLHVPKCAGTSVRKALLPIDENNGAFDRIGHHPQMGQIHFGHISLADLSRYFPAEFEKVATFQSMALVREPAERFFSGVFQRLREFGGLNQSEIDDARIKREAEIVADYLTSTSGRLELTFVHFTRQADFISHKGSKVVGNVFALERLADAGHFVARCTGINVDSTTRENRTAVARGSAMPHIVRLLRKPYLAAVPLPVRRRVRFGLERSGLYGMPDTPRLAEKLPGIRAFVEDYYGRDLTIYRQALAN